MSITGKTPFTSNGEPLGFTMSDFWEYQYTNIFDMQEYIAEFLVGKALGLQKSQNTDGWTLFDMLYRNARIEVKETSYYHSWLGTITKEICKVRTFDIHKSHCIYKDTESKLLRNNDVYVFCLNKGETREESNPLCMEHWEFYVVPTSVIDETFKDQKSVSLKRIEAISKKVAFHQLKEEIDRAIDNLPNDLSARLALENSEELNKAIELATKVFTDELDKNGEPAVLHSLRVGLAGSNLLEQIVGVLHDVVEDSDYTFEDLEREGFSKEVIDTLRLLTHDKSVPYYDYVQGIINSGNITALHVKRNDLLHNLERGKVGGHLEIVAKHTKALEMIEAAQPLGCKGCKDSKYIRKDIIC